MQHLVMMGRSRQWAFVLLILVFLESLFGGMPADAQSVPGVVPAASADDAVSTSNTARPAGSPGKVSERVRYVPFDQFQQVLDKTPKGYLIPKAEYESMKQAKESYLARHPESPLPQLPLEVCFGKAEYTATINDEEGEFEAEYLLEIPNPQWVTISLPSGDIGFKEVLVNGKPNGLIAETFAGIRDQEAPKGKVAVLQQRVNTVAAPRKKPSSALARSGRTNEYLMVLSGPGKYTIKVRFVAPKVDDPTRHEITFRIPRVPTNLFTARINKTGMYGEVDRAEGTQSLDFQGKTEITGVLGTTDRFTLRWAPKNVPLGTEPDPEDPDKVTASESVTPVPSPTPVVVRKPVEPPKLFADSYSLLSFGEGYIQTQSVIRVNVTRSPTGQISFVLASGTELLDLRSDWLESYEQMPIATGVRVVCRLKSQVQSVVEFALTADTKIGDASLAAAPLHVVEGAERDRGFVGVEARTSIEIRKGQSENAPVADETEVSSIDPSELPVDLLNRAFRPILLAYRYNAPPVAKPIFITIIRHRDVPVLTSVIDSVAATTVLETDETSITCLNLSVKNNGEQYLKAQLPPHSEIISTNVEGNPVKPVLKKGSASDTQEAFLVPLKRSQNAGAGLGAFDLQIVYRSKVPKIQWYKRLEFPLPIFDITASRLEWRLYSPDRYEVFPLPSNLDQALREPDFLPFRALHGLVREMGLPGLVLLLFLYLVYRVYRYFKQGEMQVTVSSLGSVVFLCVVLLVLASVSGPMLSSITDQSPRSSSMFGTINAKLSSTRQDVGGYSPSAAPAPYQAPSRSASNEYERKSEMMADSLDDSSLEMQAPSDKSMDSYERKAKMAAPSARAKDQGLAAAPKPQIAKKVRASRDRGALPVTMRIPTSGRSWLFFRNILKPGESTAFKGFLIWEPLHTLLFFGVGLVGLLVFLCIWGAASHSLALVAGGVFILYSMTLMLFEEAIPGIQGAGFGSFFMGLALLLIYRIYGLLKRSTTAVVAILLLLGLPGATMAQTAPPDLNPRIEQILDIYIPYSQLGDRLPKDIGMVFLPFDEYRYLRDLGIPEPDPARWVPPRSHAFVAGTLTGIVKEDHVELKAVYEIDLLGKGFKKIRFPTDRVGVRSLRLNGEPAILGALEAGMANTNLMNQNAMPQQMQQEMIQARQQVQMNVSPSFNEPGYPDVGGAATYVVTDKEGRVTLEATLIKDLFSKIEPRAKVEGFALPMPAFALGELNLSLNKARQKVIVTPSAQLKTTEVGTYTQVQALLQPTSTITVEWRAAVEEKAPEPEVVAVASKPAPLPVDRTAKVFVDHAALFSVNEGAISISDTLTVNVEKNPVGEITCTVPKDLEIIDISGSDLANWKATPTEAGQEIVLSLNAQRLNQLTFQLELERQTPQINGNFSLDLPFVTSVGPKGVIERQKGYLGVEIREGLEVTVNQVVPAAYITRPTITTPSHSRVDAQELPDRIKNNAQGFLAHAFKFIGELAPEIAITKHQNVEVSTAQIDGAIARTLITREGKILTELGLSVRNNNNQFLVLEEPATGVTLLSTLVNGEPVKPGIGKGNEVYVPLIRSPRQGKAYQPFAVTLVFEDKEGEFKKWAGNFELRLPTVSVDISEMTWVVYAQDGYMLMKGPGPFQRGSGNVGALPGTVYATDRQTSRNSNVMTQSVRSAGAPSDGTEASTGLLPVMLHIPTTGNDMSFTKKLVITKGPAPHLKILYVREAFLRLMAISILLLIALATTLTFFASWNGKSTTAQVGGLLLIVIAGAAYAAEATLGNDLPFMTMLFNSILMGFEASLGMILAWFVLRPPTVPSTESSTNRPASGDKKPQGSTESTEEK
jgi:hypothetical protein